MFSLFTLQRLKTASTPTIDLDAEDWLPEKQNLDNPASETLLTSVAWAGIQHKGTSVRLYAPRLVTWWTAFTVLKILSSYKSYSFLRYQRTPYIILKDEFTRKWKFRRYLLIFMPMDTQVKFRRQQNICGASQNSTAAFSVFFFVFVFFTCFSLMRMFHLSSKS